MFVSDNLETNKSSSTPKNWCSPRQWTAPWPLRTSGTRASAARHSASPVSYTHLDVYKRQIVEQTIASLHERGLLILNEYEEEHATRMFDGKIWLTLEDLRKHPACLWGRKKAVSYTHLHSLYSLALSKSRVSEGSCSESFPVIHALSIAYSAC